MSREYMIGGYKVHFPFKAYPSQIAMMAKVIRGADRSENALLESPTGSGKSMALLCSALAWQREQMRRRREATRVVQKYRTKQRTQDLNGQDDGSKSASLYSRRSAGYTSKNVSSKKSTLLDDPVAPPLAPTSPPLAPPPLPPTAPMDVVHAETPPQSLRPDLLSSGATPTPASHAPPPQIHDELGPPTTTFFPDSDSDDFLPLADPRPTSSSSTTTTTTTSTTTTLKRPLSPTPTNANANAPSSKRSKPLSSSSKARSKGKGVTNLDSDDDADADADADADDDNSEDESFTTTGDLEEDAKIQAALAVVKADKPKIIFASRTHSQVTQIVGELRATKYVPRMTVLASREQYCIHPKISKSSHRNEECKNALENHACGFYHNKERLITSPTFASQVWDIEDIVQGGKRKRACPYFAARELADGADIIFCPYNYLIDPLIRDSMGLSLDNSIVILDEAHNIEDSCREAGSATVTAETIDNAITDLEAGIERSLKLGAGSLTLGPYNNLLTLIRSMASWIRSQLPTLRSTGYEVEESHPRSGEALLSALSAMGFTPSSLLIFREAYNEASKVKQDKAKEDRKSRNQGGGGRSSSKADKKNEDHILLAETFQLIEVLLFVIGNCVNNEGRFAPDYVLAIRRARAKNRGGRNRRSNKGKRSKKNKAASSMFDSPRNRVRGGARTAARNYMASPLSAPVQNPYSPGASSSSSSSGTSAPLALADFEITVNFWCLNPGVVFSSLEALTRTIVLTSGTLSPLISFESELMTTFPIVLEASHVIDMETQVFVSPLAAAPSGFPIISTYKHTSTYKFQDELGETILALATIVPHGMLVFVTSYSLLDKLMERWNLTGLAKRLSAHKQIIQEPRSKNDLESTMDSFYSAIRDSEASPPTSGGAVLLAVYRGKVSEGIDFSNNNARSVLCVGIPYPNIKDRVIQLKREYNDKYAAQRGLLPGSKWYSLQAFRALNQALGRCIRHRNDYGSILLVDQRFTGASITPSLSKWIRSAIQTFPSLPAFGDALTQFHIKAAAAESARRNSTNKSATLQLELEPEPESKPTLPPPTPAAPPVHLACASCSTVLTSSPVSRRDNRDDDVANRGWHLVPDQLIHALVDIHADEGVTVPVERRVYEPMYCASPSCSGARVAVGSLARITSSSSAIREGSRVIFFTKSVVPITDGAGPSTK